MVFNGWTSSAVAWRSLGSRRESPIHGSLLLVGCAITGRLEGRSACQPDLRPATRDDGYVVHPRPLRARADRLQSRTAQNRSQNRLHLERGEGRSQTATGAAAERDPAVGRRLTVEEALGPKRAGVGGVGAGGLDQANRW